MFYNSNSTSINKHETSAKINHDLAVDSLSYTVDFSSRSISFDKSETYLIDERLNEIRSFSLGFSYLKKMGKLWSGIVSFQPKLISNFENNITIKDIQPIFFIGFSKQTGLEKTSLLKFGIHYSDFFGKPSFIPDISFNGVFSKKITYSIGFPLSEVAYKINTKNTLKAVVSSNSFYTKLNGAHYMQKELNNDLIKVIDLQVRNFNAGFEYNFMTDANWGFNINLNHSFSNDIKLLDQNDNEIKIGFDDGINFSMGFKYNLNFK
ncbi:hypothetical protein J2X31_001227 [Flavobacterium arsenatis]|uniref:DUF6268 domain-containing protein n=1 Tax=Flavobacterium arsenatis TaxID=1484332 RepID=A0ABU1TMQ3_9FLAO|nr:DUF6268 family outer membrane beta-barrel protein [Flavobacterium arsenatis]MDR6967220.1 hypothetical protein [Flavobacterium arsenatis]